MWSVSMGQRRQSHRIHTTYKTYRPFNLSAQSFCLRAPKNPKIVARHNDHFVQTVPVQIDRAALVQQTTIVGPPGTDQPHRVRIVYILLSMNCAFGGISITSGCSVVSRRLLRNGVSTIGRQQEFSRLRAGGEFHPAADLYSEASSPRRPRN